jgi:hypothetical protein
MISMVNTRPRRRARTRLDQLITLQSVGIKQGDQMSLWKNRSKCCPTHFLSKLIHNLYFGKSSRKLWAISVITWKLPQVKIRPLDENSPNLVTLASNNFQKDIPSVTCGETSSRDSFRSVRHLVRVTGLGHFWLFFENRRSSPHFGRLF